VVDERVGVVAVDVDVVDAEQVVLPDDVAIASAIQLATASPPLTGSAFPYCAHTSSASTPRRPALVEAVDRRRVAVEHVGDVRAVLQGADRGIGAGGPWPPCHATFIQTLLVCVNSSNDGSPRLRP
jgi:hypothetical protein